MTTSERGRMHFPALANSERLGPLPPDLKVEVTLFLRGKRKLTLPSRRERHLTHRQYETSFGASSTDIALVEAFAREHKLGVIGIETARRTVHLTGTVRQFDEAFGIELSHFKNSHGVHRGHEQVVTLPRKLRKVVRGVLGLDDLPGGRRGTPAPSRHSGIPKGALTPRDIARLYNFPADLNGKGQCIGIVELGGGYRMSDFRTYFTTLGTTLPEIACVGPNRPKQDARINMEVAMDLEVAGLIAPKAKFVFYFAKANTPKGFVDVMNEAIHDRVNLPSVISVSWGAPERNWPAAAAQLMSEVVLSAAKLGITVCIASGDFGASEGLAKGQLSPSIPASVPGALACGGTELHLNKGRINKETVWNDAKSQGGVTGGGVSALFKRPDYQKKARVPPLPAAGARQGEKAGFNGRGVPDVAGDAAPGTGYLIHVADKWSVHGGTSAVAPLWAALIALCNQRLGRRAGFLNPLLYQLRNSAVFRQVTKGNNGFYPAKRGWNACTGLGTPDGEILLAALMREIH